MTRKATTTEATKEKEEEGKRIQTYSQRCGTRTPGGGNAVPHATVGENTNRGRGEIFSWRTEVRAGIGVRAWRANPRHEQTYSFSVRSVVNFRDCLEFSCSLSPAHSRQRQSPRPQTFHIRRGENKKNGKSWEVHEKDSSTLDQGSVPIRRGFADFIPRFGHLCNKQWSECVPGKFAPRSRNERKQYLSD